MYHPWKKWLFISLAGFAILFILLLSESDTQVEAVKSPIPADVSKNHKAAFAEAETKPRQLPKLVIDDCKNYAVTIRQKKSEIENNLLHFLEDELSKGTSIQELLANRPIYKKWPLFYQQMLFRAIRNNEKRKDKYDFSKELIKNWKGMNLFKEDMSEAQWQQLLSLKGGNSFKSVYEKGPLLDKTIIEQLVENDDDFLTFLDLRFFVDDYIPISPAMLFVLGAQRLELSHYKKLVSQQRFSVNEVSVAITNHMSAEYLQPLLENTMNIHEVPYIVKQDILLFLNLADVAIAYNHLEALRLLKQFDVLPSDSPNSSRALDFAVAFLSTENINLEQDSDVEEYLETIKYLISEGYHQVNGRYSPIPNNNDIRLGYSLNYRLFLDRIDNSQVHDLLSKMEVLEKGTSHIEETVDSNVSKKVLETNLKLKQQTQFYNQCTELAKQEKAAELFMSEQEVFNVIYNILDKNSNTALELHKVDPAFVNFWFLRIHRRFMRTSTYSNEFYSLLNKLNTTNLVEYVSSHGLSESDSEVLSMRLASFPDELMPVWQARTEPQPLVYSFSSYNVTLKSIRAMHQAGFNFFELDRFGNDIFAATADADPAIFDYLVSIGVRPSAEGLSVDVLDVLLELSYKQRRLHKNTSKVLKYITQFDASHYSRVARLRQFLPEVYQQLILINQDLTPPDGTEVNSVSSIK